MHVLIEPAEAEKVGHKWETWGGGVRLLNSPYRRFIEPLLGYITEMLQQRQVGETITIMVPEFISNNLLAAALHMNTADLIRKRLKQQQGVVIINVPYHVQKMKNQLITDAAALPGKSGQQHASIL